MQGIDPCSKSANDPLPSFAVAVGQGQVSESSSRTVSQVTDTWSAKAVILAPWRQRLVCGVNPYLNIASNSNGDAKHKNFGIGS